MRLIDPDDPSRSLNGSISNVDRLNKLTGRMPKRNLFGDMVQLWLYDQAAAKPDYASRRAVRIVRADADDTGSDLTWRLLREISHLPILDHWRKPVIRAAERHGWITYHPGVGVHALTLSLSSCDFEAAIEALIVDGTLTLTEKGVPISNRAC